MDRISKYLLLLIFSTFFLTPCWSQVDTSKKNRNNVSIPKRTGKWVNDLEKIFSSSEVRILDSIASSFEESTSIEIAVVTFDSSYSTAENFDNFVLSIHNSWGVGKKESNNGIVIGVSRALRKIRISNGYGIEKLVTDEETKQIIDQVIVPEFKKSNYFKGVKNGMQSLVVKLQ